MSQKILDTIIEYPKAYILYLRGLVDDSSSAML